MPDYTVKTDIDNFLRSNDYPDARTRLGLGTAAQNATGDFLSSSIDTLAEINAIFTDGTILVDDADARLSNARTPTTHDHPLSDLQTSGATNNQIPTYNSTSGEWEAKDPPAGGAGDMLASTYDNTGKALNVYDMGNMDEAVNALILTTAERNAIVANTNKATNVSTDLDYTASPTNGLVTSSDGTDATLSLADATNAGLLTPGDFGKLEDITVTAPVNLDTLATDSHTHSNKATLDATTASFTTEEETKLAGIWGGENKLDGTTGPTANSDSANTDTNGTFSVGSVWVDTTGNESYRCVDSTPTAAVWVKTTLGTDDLALIATSGSATDLTTGTLPIARIAAGTITENELNATTNASLDLADSASQPGHTHAQVDITDLSAASTGVLTGGQLSLGATSTRYSIADGSGIIVDETGAITEVSWASKFNIVPGNINIQQITFVSIDSGGNVVEQAGPWSPQQRREQICLGVAVHVDFTNVVAVNDEQVISFNPMSSAYDIGEALGFLNLEGNVFSPDAQTATMAIAKSEGEIFKMGANYNVNTKAPHNKILPLLDPVTFGYRYSAGNTDANQTVIDPNNLDDGANGLTPISGNANANIWSIQRIYSFISNNVFIQRGVEEFGSQADAIAGVGSENYMVEASIEANGLFRGYLIVKKGETDLNSADTTFIAASKFGASGGGASGASPHTPEGTAVQSTGETEGLKFLREDGDGTSSWQKVTEEIGFAMSDEDTAPLTAGEAVVFDMPYDFEITRVYATVKTAGGTTAIPVRLKDEATNILASDLGIQPGTNNAEASGAVFNGGTTSYTITKGSRFAAEIVLPDTSNIGAGLKAFIEGVRV